MEILIRIGRDKGLDEIYGEVLPDNEKMLGLCRDLDFTMGLPSQGMIRVSLKLK
jgi:acetyltransferase